MFKNKLFDPSGFIIAAATFLFSFLLFFNDTGVFLGSVFAALMAAGLIWMTYLVIRLVYIAFSK